MATPAHSIYIRAIERALLANESGLERQLGDLLAPVETDEQPDEWATDRGFAINARSIA